MTVRVEPKPTQQVWAWQRVNGGKVTVHEPNVERFTDLDGWWTMCDRFVEQPNYRWMWTEYRTLNPMYVYLCKRCWK